MSDPIVFACLAVGEMNGRADLYIERLAGMLRRHCARPHRLVCFTDRERALPPAVEQRSVAGWQGLRRAGMRPTTLKLGLFDPGLTGLQRFLYLDLTLVIRAPLEPLLSFAWDRPQALVIVADWHHETYNSSVMRIAGDGLRAVHDDFVAGVAHPQRVLGDQDFITAVVRARGLQPEVETLPPGMVESFKRAVRTGRRRPDDARRMVDGAIIVKFHGKPRMDDVFDPWQHFWRIRVRDWAHGRFRPPVDVDALRRHWQGG